MRGEPGKIRLSRNLPHVLYQSELAVPLHELHQMILEGESDFHKEELLLFLLEQLLREYSNTEPPAPIQELSTETKLICDYIESHYTENITLNQLSDLTGISKYHLLRVFTRQKGISPYRYLETFRISQA